MPKGWKLISLYCETDGQIFVSFAHYTGCQAHPFGDHFNKVLRGRISPETLRKALQKHLTLQLSDIRKQAKRGGEA
jgi:hypothetical protein